MTDKSATERLREMLDERGVAHSDHYLSTTWRDGHGILHLAGEPMADGSLVVDMLTPEQAIAATLGNELNPDGLPVGLTISEDGELLNWCGENYVKQSMLGGGECEVVASYDTSDVDSRNSSAEWYFAFSCGHELYWDEGEPPKHCPECGAKIRKAVKR